MYQFFKTYFSFNSRERIAIVLLICLMALFWILPNYYPTQQFRTIEPKTYNSSALPFKVDSFTTSKLNRQVDKPVINYLKTSLFYFDPNKLDYLGWEKLGLRKKLIQTILNYRSKGGKFKQPSDLSKIWGMQPTEADRLIPYVTIEKEAPIQQKQAQTMQLQPQIVAKPRMIDINTATIADWQILPGMSLPLATRLVHFRDKMGGFKRLDQVKKTYGLSDSLFQLISPYLQIEKIPEALININTASVTQLQQCKFITSDIAKAIVVYRNAYGLFLEVDDLKKILFITKEQLETMKPFIVVK